MVGSRRRAGAIVVAVGVLTAVLAVGMSPATALGPPPLLGQISTDVSLPGVLRTPTGVAVGSDGSVYVADTLNHRVQRFAADGTLLNAWGGKGTTNGTFDHPFAVALDPTGNVYVTDQGNNRVQKFSATGTFLTTWGSAGTANGRFDEPHGIAVGHDGVVYVADSGNFRVQRFNSSGAFLGSWAQSNAAWGVAVDGANVYVTVSQVGGSPLVQKRTPTGQFVSSWVVGGTLGSTLRLAITVGANGNVYVTHPFDRVVEYTSSGAFVSSAGTAWFEPRSVAVTGSGNLLVSDEGGLREYQPSGVAVRTFGSAGSGEVPGDSHTIAVEVDAAGNRYIADFGLHRILKFDADGTLVDEWGGEGTANGKFNLPVDVAVDDAGNVYVVDTNNARIQKFDSSGEFATTWGTAGSAPGQFSVPGGIDVDTAGNVYVADSGNARVQKFNGSGTFLASWGGSGTGQGQFTFPSDITMDPSGNLYVIDSAQSRVQRFTPGGTFLSSWAAVGRSIAVNSTGDVFVANGEVKKIRRYTSAGSLVTQWSLGLDPSSGAVPLGVAVDRDDHVHVADFESRIQEFGSTSVEYRPDAVIRLGATGVNKGNGIYNTTGAQQTRSASVSIGAAATYFVTFQNDSAGRDRLRIRSNSPSSSFSARYKIGNTDVSLGVQGFNAPYFLTDVLQPGEQVVVKVKVTPVLPPRGQVFRGKLTVTSDGDPTVKDVVLFTTTSR